jgi:hypothetical protein
MTKFDGIDDPGFISVAGELERIAKRLKVEPDQAKPGLAVEATPPTATTVPHLDEGGGDRSIPIRHNGDNIRSNVSYGGTQTIHGDVTTGESDNFLSTSNSATKLTAGPKANIRGVQEAGFTSFQLAFESPEYGYLTLVPKQ